jgi:alkylation response protein AidB-like acyl-CoA dehydrogenase
MPLYRAPLEDYRFVLDELLEIDKQRDLPQFADLSPDVVQDVLIGAANFCEDVLQPINQSGDEEGCHFENGVVRTPKGFREAYRAYCKTGWAGLGAPAALGGADLPIMIAMAVAEMAQSANQSFAMYPFLTTAAYSALALTGAPWMREHVATKMVSGEWCGTMCLTEPHCGTDLRLIKTKAIEQEDGTYRLTGTKIFISGGDHDLTDNIIHMVIAKICDDSGKISDDLSTVNFFMVPKFLVSEDGAMGARNSVTTGGIEKKMGIKAQATCVLNFDDAVAWRLGPKPTQGEKRSSSSGMAGMFGMMNLARLGVGIQGISIAEVAYQNALAYAQGRRVGRALTGVKDPDKPADVEFVHPDVRRMLLHCKSFIEGARALAMWTTLNMAIARSSRPDAETASLLADLLTPVIKAFFTDMGFEAANLALQCYGGHGYIRDNGVEQFVRDARINQLYEGANGVQAMDLVGRKLGRKGGAAPLALFALIDGWMTENRCNARLGPFSRPLKRGLDALQQATMWLAQNGPTNPNHAGAAAVDYLRLMGIVVTAWMWARMAKVAQNQLEQGSGSRVFYEAKLISAQYWMERLIPECPMLLEKIRIGSGTLMAFNG